MAENTYQLPELGPRAGPTPCGFLNIAHSDWLRFVGRAACAGLVGAAAAELCTHGEDAPRCIENGRLLTGLLEAAGAPAAGQGPAALQRLWCALQCNALAIQDDAAEEEPPRRWCSAGGSTGGARFSTTPAGEN